MTMDIKPNPASSSVDDSGGQASSPLESLRGVWGNICSRIIGGLILVMPFLITFWVIRWMYSLLEEKVIDPLAMLVCWKLRLTTSATELPYWLETYGAPLIAIAVALTGLYLVDYFADSRLRRGVGWLLTNVPVISVIYSPVQKMFQSMEKKPGKQTPQKMVLVGFPHPGIKVPAFVTAKCRDIETQRTLVCVYVPTTPVPTSGFFLLVPEDEVVELNWSIEQALQAVMSGGLTAPSEVRFFSSKTAPTFGAGSSLPIHTDSGS
jgi:uncharacterized membrane protein